MIFSKDKRPTEAGWYWANAANERSPFVVLVGGFGNSEMMVLDLRAPGAIVSVQQAINLGLLIGDRIELPSVETGEG